MIDNFRYYIFVLRLNPTEPLNAHMKYEFRQHEKQIYIKKKTQKQTKRLYFFPESSFNF